MTRLTETVIRDANQSLLATRMPRKAFADILSTMDKVGYYSLECWGGATFDSCLRFLKEDPWERLRFIREQMPNTKLQMLLRGQSLLGYHHYPDDVVEQFVKCSIENGIDIIRIFDALNDLKNIEVALEATHKAGGHASCAMSYTTSPIHNNAYYVGLAKEMVAMGAQSICVKDMAGLLQPEAAYDLISALKDSVACPVILHSHCTTGMAAVTYYNAIRAGVDVLDTASTAFSGGTSQPSTEVIARMIKGLGSEHGLDMERVRQVDKHFHEVYRQCHEEKAIAYQVTKTDPGILDTQIPGGMYSNLFSQIKYFDMGDRMDELMAEIPVVRKDLGYPPLVTPISQMVGTQAIVNLMGDARYSNIISEVKAYFEGKYGVPPAPWSKELQEKITGGQGIPVERYSKALPAALPDARRENPELSTEDLLSLLLFPAQARAFFELRNKPYAPLPDGYFFSGDAKPQDRLKAVTPPEEDYARILAVLAYRLKRDVKQVQIKGFYQEEGV